MNYLKPHPMRNNNPFKLGIFSANADGGLTLTKVPERWPAQWDQIASVAQIADRAGLEFFLPIARWKGFGGETNARNWSFETLTFGAGLAAVTERIAIFCTVHAPLVNPVFAAKALATVDHISQGRAGLNIVCGWNQPEFEMFGSTQADDRYAQGLEWYDVISRIYANEGAEEFDYNGKYYQLKGVTGAPPSLQKPRPVTLSAAFSPPGRDFAAKTSDFLFTTFVDIDSGTEHIKDIRTRGEKEGRELGVFTTCHVVCRETEKEAQDYYQHYAVNEADEGAVNQHMQMKKAMANSYDEAAFQYKKRFAGGVGTYPLVGTAEQIVEQMQAMHHAGFAGTTLSFVNYLEELPHFCNRVLPLMEQAGLRYSMPSSP